MAPLSSLLMSTMTEPFPISFSMDRSMRKSLQPLGHLTQLSTISVSGSSWAMFSLVHSMVSMCSWYCRFSVRRIPMLMSMTVTLAPKAYRTDRAAWPTVPPPRISTLMAGAPPSPLTNLPLPPLMDSMDSRPIRAPCLPAASQLGEPYRWQSSAVKAMQPLSRMAWTSWGWAAGWMQVKMICPFRSSGNSQGSSSFTLVTKSAWP